MIYDFIVRVWGVLGVLFDTFYDVLTWLLHGIVYVLLSIPLALFKVALGFTYLVVSVFNVGSLAVDITTGWGLLPPQLGYLIGQTGLDVGLSMLALAYGIRFTLNLIPAVFTRV